MLDLKLIKKNKEDIKNKLTSRNFDVSIIDEVFLLSNQRTKIMTKLQNLNSKRNLLSKKIGENKKTNKNVSFLTQEVSKIKDEIEKINKIEKQINEKIISLLLIIPNLPNINTPIGKDENDNIVIKEHSKLGNGKITDVKPHYNIATDLDIVDFNRAVKLSGSRYWLYKNDGAKLVRALKSFMLDIHTQKGYQEILPPIIVKANIMQGTGQLPKFKEDLFKIEGLDSYLIPTAEVPLTNLYANEIVDLTKPIMLTAYTPCFRAESGSGGKDMKGLIRSHQFNKVELVKIVADNQIKKEFIKTVEDAKNILELLQIPYRELRLCSGDLGFSAEETIDLEIWLPSEKRYREVSSISSFGDFQARRAKIRYKNNKNKNVYASTINGSGLAIDRVIASLLEVYQNKDGTITIPEKLIPYMNNQKIIK